MKAMKLSKFKQGDIVLIKWTDSFSSSRWYSDSEIDDWQKDPVICISIGCFFKATKKSVVVYQSASPYEVGTLTNIPRCVITSSKLIKRFK